MGLHYRGNGVVGDDGRAVLGGYPDRCLQPQREGLLPPPGSAASLPPCWENYPSSAASECSAAASYSRSTAQCRSAVPDPSESKRLEGPPRDAWSFRQRVAARARMRAHERDNSRSRGLEIRSKTRPWVVSSRTLRHVENLEKSLCRQSCESRFVFEYSTRTIERELFVGECDQFGSAAPRPERESVHCVCARAYVCVIKMTNREWQECCDFFEDVQDLIGEHWITDL